MCCVLYLAIFSEWIASRVIQKISMVICNADTKEVLECWDFKLQLEKTDIPEGCAKYIPVELEFIPNNGAL